MSKRFLITGLPRMRSAWLAALFSSPVVECFHDAIHHGGVDKMLDAIIKSKSPIVGLIDPSASCVYPRESLALFSDSPITVVLRNEEDCRTGLERWYGSRMSNWEDLVRNHTWFQVQASRRFYAIHFDSMNDYAAVAEMYHICTGLVLDNSRFDLFNTLKIEQHYEKAAHAAASLRH